VPHGETPVAVRGLTLGAHVIVVTMVGYPQWHQTATLTEDRPSQSFEASLDGASAAVQAPLPAPATTGLQIDSRPTGAQVFVDGAPVGVTPVLLPTIATGAHTVRIELAGGTDRGRRPCPSPAASGRASRRRSSNERTFRTGPMDPAGNFRRMNAVLALEDGNLVSRCRDRRQRRSPR
jgi:hypothetical protein